MGKLLHERETYQIRGACFWVRKEFGGAFKESVIHRALVHELKCRNLFVESQRQIPLHYRGVKVGAYVPDIVVNGRIIVELKCKPYLTQEDERQFWHYLKGSNFSLGMLINFGPRGLEIRRRIYTKKVRA